MHKDLTSVQKMFRAIETGDTTDVDTYISHKYLNRESVDDGRSDSLGTQEFLETVAWMRSMFADLKFEHLDAFRCDDRAVVVTKMCGKQVADFFGIQSTGCSFSQRQIHIFRLDGEGKVSEHFAQRDDMGLRQQLASAGASC